MHNKEQSIVVKHLPLLGLALVVLGAIYYLTRNASAIAMGGIVLIAAHLTVIGLVAYLGRMIFIRSRPRHLPAGPETEGITIRWASFYDSFVWLLLRLLGERITLEAATLEQVQLSRGDKVLDVGCGTGSLALAAPAQVGPEGEVHGIDASPEMVDMARRKVSRAGENATFRVGVAEDLPFPDCQFDIVLSSLMVHHLPGADSKRKVFAEVHRVLKPGGQLLVVDFEPPTKTRARLVTSLLLGHTMAHNDVQELPPMLEAAGFTQIESGNTGHQILSFVRADKASGVS